LDHRWQKPGDCLAFRYDEIYPILLANPRALKSYRTYRIMAFPGLVAVILKRFTSRSLQIGLLALLLAVGCHSAGLAAVMGGVTPVPYPEAVERSRLAARAVLERRGAEACLRGKLTGALLALSASCEAEARQTPLCALAERAVVSSDWRLATMDATAFAILAQPA
jgi:hypothetical protein